MSDEIKGMPQDKVEEALHKADTAIILLEGLVNYLRALNVLDVEDFNKFLQESQVTVSPMFRSSGK